MSVVYSMSSDITLCALGWTRPGCFEDVSYTTVMSVVYSLSSNITLCAIGWNRPGCFEDVHWRSRSAHTFAGQRDKGF